MADQDKQFVAERVSYYLKDAHPGGTTLEVLASQIWHEEFGWHVPVRPDFEPKRLFEYYEALAEAEIALRDEDDLSVFLIPETATVEVANQIV